MPDVCEWCEPGGYYDCGPDGTRCQLWDDPDEDRCHNLLVLVRKRGGCCEARLWPEEIGRTPPGWKVFQKVPIRVQTNEVKGHCVARVHVPEVDCDKYKKRCNDDDGMDVDDGLDLVVHPGSQIVINFYQ